MVEESKLICDGCGKDITDALCGSWRVRRKRPFKVRLRIFVDRSMFTGKIRNSQSWLSAVDSWNEADLCDECFKNICRWMGRRCPDPVAGTSGDQGGKNNV